MLSMGFYPDMKRVKRYLPEKRQSLMFSATMPPKVQAVGREFLAEPAFLSLSGGTIHVDIMTHRAYEVDRMEKDRALAALIELEDAKSAVVFANTRRDVDYLTTYLQNAGYNAAGISSDLTQKAREEVMGRLRTGELRILVATDVAARGIDVEDLTHVFQVDVPQDQEYYIHRAGRTARAGKTGTSISFVTSSDKPMLKQIGGRYGIDFEWAELPTDEEVSEVVANRVVKLLEDRYESIKQLDRERIGLFIPLAERLVEEGEPELLAMLLRDVAQRAKHHDDPFALVEKPKRAERREKHDEDRSSGGRGRGKGKSRKSGGRH
jgi:ATP-dependent RNA helicase DeaD